MNLSNHYLESLVELAEQSVAEASYSEEAAEANYCLVVEANYCLVVAASYSLVVAASYFAEASCFVGAVAGVVVDQAIVEFAHWSMRKRQLHKRTLSFHDVELNTESTEDGLPIYNVRKSNPYQSE